MFVQLSNGRHIAADKVIDIAVIEPAYQTPDMHAIGPVPCIKVRMTDGSFYYYLGEEGEGAYAARDRLVAAMNAALSGDPK